MPRNRFLPPLRHEVDRLFDSLIHSAWGPPQGAAAWMPALDVLEEEETYRLEMDLPGVRSQDVSIGCVGRTLRIEGKRERFRRSGAERPHLVERICGHFVRTLQLPDDAEPSGIRVSLTDGVLTIEIPRRR